GAACACISFRCVLPAFPTRRSSDLLFLSASSVKAKYLSNDAPAAFSFQCYLCETGYLLTQSPLACSNLPRAMVEIGVDFLQGVGSEEHTSELQCRETLVCRLLPAQR